MRITRDRPNFSIYLDKQAAISAIVKKHNITKIKPTPMEINLHLTKEPNENKTDLKQYQQMIGDVIAVMIACRPDICFAVSKLAQYMANPYESHKKAMIHLLEYLNGTQNYALRLGNNQGKIDQVLVYADSDWANDKDDRKSISGYAIKFRNSLIDWKTKKQSIIALSSTEAELYALSSSVQELTWIKNLLKSIGIELDEVKIYEDNMSTISIVENNKKDGRTKHVEVKKLHVHHALKDNPKFKLEYITTANQLADALNKIHSPGKFNRFREDMGIVKVPIHLLESD
jgi:hypothetical protein